MIDERLSLMAAAPTTYGNEGSGQDGGFLVPPEFGREVFRHSLEGDALLWWQREAIDDHHAAHRAAGRRGKRQRCAVPCD